MKHKKRRRPRHEQSKTDRSANPAWERVKDRFRRINRRTVMITLFWFLGAELFYTVCNYFTFTFHLYLYPIAFGVLALAYFILNGGRLGGQAEFNPSALPSSMTEEEKQKAENAFNLRRKWAKSLLPPLFAIITTLCIDLIYLNWVLS